MKNQFIIIKEREQFDIVSEMLEDIGIYAHYQIQSETEYTQNLKAIEIANDEIHYHYYDIPLAANIENTILASDFIKQHSEN